MNEEDSNIDLGIEYPSIFIELFAKKYLPLVFDPDPATFNLAWLNEVAMNVYNPVKVLNADGSVAYTVPPLRRQIESGTDGDYFNLVSYAANEAKMHPARGRIAFENGIAGLIKFESGRDPESERIWKEIIIRHGYGDRLVNIGGSTTSSGGGPGNVIISDDLDDWD